MARNENLNKEDEAEQDGHLVGRGEVGAKQAVRQGNDHEGRDELTQIEGCREQGHDGGGRVLSALDAGDGVQVGHTHAIGDTDERRAQDN